MRKLLSLLLVLALLPFTALADYNLSEMTEEELYALMDSIGAELDRREQEHLEGSIEMTAWYTAQYLMADYLRYNINYTDSKMVRLDNDYVIHTEDGTRFLRRKNRLLKVSSRVDLEDNDTTALRMYLIAAILEGALYTKDKMTASDKKSAFELADNIVNTAVDVFGDNLARVYESGEEGFSMLAATGQYVYHWEYIDGSAWFSVEFGTLPEGMY